MFYYSNLLLKMEIVGVRNCVSSFIECEGEQPPVVYSTQRHWCHRNLQHKVASETSLCTSTYSLTCVATSWWLNFHLANSCQPSNSSISFRVLYIALVWVFAFYCFGISMSASLSALVRYSSFSETALTWHSPLPISAWLITLVYTEVRYLIIIQ